jgi:hypothetical protein
MTFQHSEQSIVELQGVHTVLHGEGMIYIRMLHCMASSVHAKRNSVPAM